MKIYRNGEEIELTASELADAYREQQITYAFDDARNYAELGGFLNEVTPEEMMAVVSRYLYKYDSNYSDWDNFEVAFEAVLGTERFRKLTCGEED